MIDLQKHIIGLVFYPGMTSLDIVRPHQVFLALPGVELHRIWKTLNPIITDDGLVIVLDTTFANCPPLDVICVGGGLEQRAEEKNMTISTQRDVRATIIFRIWAYATAMLFISILLSGQRGD